MAAPTVSEGGRRRAGAPGYSTQPDRLPAPTRERRPALAALAVLLIVGGALLTALIVLRSGQRTDYLVMTRDVAVGQQITNADLGTASLSGDVRAIPAVNRAAFVGSYAAVQLSSGQLPLAKMFSPHALSAPGAALVGVVLADGSRPSVPLVRDDVVGLYVVPSGNQSAASTTATLLIHAVRVVDVAEADRGIGGTEGQYVTLLVPAAKAGDVTFNSVNKQLAVVKLPPGTAPDVDYTVNAATASK